MDNKSEYHVKVFDTTLRDGQQCPGAAMSFRHNLEYARLATLLKVDVLEAGFPAASSLDFEIVEAIAGEAAGNAGAPVIAGLCQLKEKQVACTMDALQALLPAGKARLHTYFPVAPDLMQASLGEQASNCVRIAERLYGLTKMAVQAGFQVQFSPEGYSRLGDNFDFTTELIRAAIEGGATTINCPDTIGGACEAQGSDYFVSKMNLHAQIIAQEYPAKQITWSVHCHNDFGLAAQNTINAVFQGPARQIEVCTNGIGERAGNAALEQCVMLIKHFGGCQDPGNPFFTTIAYEQLQAVSDFVGRNMLPRQPHWPVSGVNAACHTSGGHTNAILHNPLAYQPFDPREIGKSISLVFGPLSGGNHAQAVIRKYGYACEDSEKAEIAQFIKDTYNHRRKGITDEELLAAYFAYRKQPAKPSVA